MPAVPDLDEVLSFCAEDPVERVLLEDVARRGLGRFAALRVVLGSTPRRIVVVTPTAHLKTQWAQAAADQIGRAHV